MLRATTVSHDRSEAASARLVLTHDERHLRRKVLMLDGGERVLVDLAQATALCDGDRLVLDDGRRVEVIAAQEALLEVRGETPRALTVLAWHIGNRHLPAQVEADRILIGRDHVIADMLAGLGAGVREVVEPFTPERGAYSGHSHAGSHAHGHDHGGGHAHGHAEGHTHSHDHDEAHEAGGADPMGGITGRAVKDHA